VSTYTALQADVASYLHRSDLTTPIQGFIEKTRLRIGRDLRSLEQEAVSTLTSPTADVFALPTDFQEATKVHSAGVPLRPVNFSEITYWTAADSPYVYCIYGRNIWVPGATTISLGYFKVEATLSSGSTEHPTMAAHPQIWLYASLAEAGLYTRDWDLMDRMTMAYREEVRLVNQRAEWARTGPAPSVVTEQLMILSEAGL
jgi:hypothetical protein